MKWQDAVFAVGSVIFVLALIPSILGPHKPSFWSSIITTVVLIAFSVVYVSLRFWFSFAVNDLDVLCWSILAWQRRGLVL